MSFKVNDFRLVWRGVWHFLLVINFGPISHRFRDTAIYSLKLSIEKCSQTAADGYMVIIDSLPIGSRRRRIRWYVLLLTP